MYIRRMMVRGRFSYWLRESVWQGDYWGFRDLLDLGHDPSDFIELPGGNGFYFKPELEQALAAAGVAWTSEELDFLFLPFLPQHIQRVIEAFGGVGPPPDPRLRLDPDQLRESLELIHPFDKRRLHFLRCGRVDMGRLQGRVLKLFGARVKKSEGRLGDPGTVLRLTPQGLEIACGQGSVTVEALQLAGHKRLSAADFLRGQPLIGQRLE